MCFTLYCMYCSYLYIYVRSMVNVSLFNNLGILNSIAYSIKEIVGIYGCFFSA